MADIIFLLILAVFIFCGAKRGFIRSGISLIATAVSIVMGMLLMNPVAAVLKSGGLAETVQTTAMNWLEKRENAQVPLPDFMLNGVYETASDAFSELVVNTLSFIIVIILAKVITGILANIVSAAFKLPVLKQANALLGGAVGGICGVIISYLIVTAVAVLAPMYAADELSMMLDKSLLLSGWFNDNILINSFMNF